MAYWAEVARGRGGGVASSTSSTSHSLSQSRKYSRLAVLRSVPSVPRAEPRSATDMYRDLSLKIGTLRTSQREDGITIEIELQIKLFVGKIHGAIIMSHGMQGGLGGVTRWASDRVMEPRRHFSLER